MQLSLSVRIAEGFLSKEIPLLPLAEVADIARGSGYTALCLRASQVGVHSSNVEIAASVETVQQRELKISMLTGDFDTVYNNATAPRALRNIQPYLQLAQQFNCTLLRVAIKSDQEIEHAQDAADLAARVGIRLAHQCHTLSLFETVPTIIDTLQKVNRPNFGLIYEPANLQICGQDYGSATLSELAPWIMNVYLQNQILRPEGKVSLETWCRGAVSLDVVPIHQSGSIDFAAVIAGLQKIDYQGYLTVHQSATDGEAPAQSARLTANYLSQLIEAS